MARSTNSRLQPRTVSTVLRAALFALAVLAITACPVETEEKSEDPIAASGPPVYTAGLYNNGGSKACYWKGEVKTDLSNTNSFARAITVSGGTVYTAGGYSFDGVDTFKACYWAGGGRTELPVPVGVDNSKAEAIAVV